MKKNKKYMKKTILKAGRGWPLPLLRSLSLSKGRFETKAPNPLKKLNINEKSPWLLHPRIKDAKKNSNE